MTRDTALKLEEMRRTAELDRAYLAGRMTEADYKRAIDRLAVDLIRARATIRQSKAA